MIHPDTELRLVNKEIGYGVFATKLIPKGTIVYVKDALEITVPPNDPKLADPDVAAVVEKYSYIDAKGNRIVSWDLAKYVNHCCNCNTITTGYGFEIAIRDIAVGEEITDDYGLFNLNYELPLSCKQSNCRRKVGFNDHTEYAELWDQKIKSALAQYQKVEQPLEKFMDKKICASLYQFLNSGSGYTSVLTQKYQPKTSEVAKLHTAPRKMAAASAGK